MLLRQPLTLHCVYGQKSSVNLILNALQRYCSDEWVCGSLALSLCVCLNVLWSVATTTHRFMLSSATTSSFHSFPLLSPIFLRLSAAAVSSCVCVSLYWLYYVWLCLPSNVRFMLQHQNKIAQQSGEAHATTLHNRRHHRHRDRF